MDWAVEDWIIWLVAGLVLIIAEALIPGVFLMWIGLAAVGTGLAVLGFGFGFDLSVVVFGLLAAVSLAAGLRLRRPVTRLNTQSSGLAGRSAVALSFHGREGRVKVGDSDWAARVPPDVAEPAAGTRMRVEGVDGTVLIVRPEEAGR